MMICVECERVFDQPNHIVERHGLDTPPYEEYDGCPLLLWYEHPSSQAMRRLRKVADGRLHQDIGRAANL